MKVPFRQQVSNYDCTPTSLINALSYLFGRKDFPPFIVQQVYKECLDIEAARGTSDRAVHDLAFLLKNYNEKKYRNFTVDSKILSESQVHLRRNSKIIQCINKHGVAVLTVHLSRNMWHSIIAFKACDGWLYCHDPAPHSSKRFITNSAIQFIPPIKPHDPNLKILTTWIDKDFDNAETTEERKYILGPIEDRECLLLNRIKS